MKAKGGVLLCLLLLLAVFFYFLSRATALKTACNVGKGSVELFCVLFILIMTLTYISLKAKCFNYPRSEEKFLTFFIIILLHLAPHPTTTPTPLLPSLLLLLKEVIYPSPQPAVVGFNLRATSAINIYRRLKKKGNERRKQKQKQQIKNIPDVAFFLRQLYVIRK